MGTSRYLFQASTLSAKTGNFRGTPSSGSADKVVTLIAPPEAALRRKGSRSTIKPASAGTKARMPLITAIADFLKKSRRTHPAQEVWRDDSVFWECNGKFIN